jgi:uncharacterized protein YjbJ (UPF0337 family)
MAPTLQHNFKTTIMHSKILKLKGDWNEVKGKMKQEYAQLTDDDLKYDEGQDDELIGRVQKKIGKTKEQVIDWIQSL